MDLGTLRCPLDSVNNYKNNEQWKHDFEESLKGFLDAATGVSFGRYARYLRERDDKYANAVMVATILEGCMRLIHGTIAYNVPEKHQNEVLREIELSLWWHSEDYMEKCDELMQQDDANKIANAYANL